jgi:hypothetical protein
MKQDSISLAIFKLNLDSNNDYRFIICGKISNEQEYISQVKYFIDGGEGGTSQFLNTQPYTWTQIKSKQAEADFEIEIKTLRAKRNKLLADTDYLALSDNTMTEEVRTYRQALRDITEGLSTIAEVEAVEFPVKP